MSIIDDIERAEGKATAAPWEAGDERAGQIPIYGERRQYPDRMDSVTWLASVMASQTSEAASRANADLIVLSRNHLCALIAIARAAHAYREAYAYRAVQHAMGRTDPDLDRLHKAREALTAALARVGMVRE